MSDVSGNGLIVEQIEESITFNDIQLHLVSEENIQQIDDELDQTNQFISLKNPPKHNYCINRIIKKLKNDMNCSNKNHRLLITMMICVFALPCLTVVAYFMPVYPSYTSINRNIIWYRNEIIYEINVPMFRDSNQDGIGDLKGILEKLDYFEKNNIQSILLQSSIFNVSDELFEISDRQYAKSKITDLLKLDPQIGSEDDFSDFMKILARQNIHLIVDLPLSSTGDHKDLSWYGFNTSSSIKIENPCLNNKNDLGCKYYKIYKQLPLDFSNKEIADAAESRLRYWLAEKNIDGIRVDLPLTLDQLSNTYQISLETIHQWKIITKEIESKTTPKLLLFDIPFNLQSIIDDQSLYDQIIYSIPLQRLANMKQEFTPNYSTGNNESVRQSFWQIGSSREYVRLGMMHDVSQRIFHTIGMLIGGTPIVLYGDELGIKQRTDPWMIWTSDPPYGGFSSCLSEKCNDTLSSYDDDVLQTNVKSQEINVDIDNESLLIFFRRLSKLRQHESFQNGILKKGYDLTSDILWFIREVPGHRGFLIVIHSDRFKEEAIRISLQNLTNQQIPNPIYYEYRSANLDLLPINSFPVDSDKLLIYPGSIHIFWWPTRVS